MIITAIEALRAVPIAIREAGYGVGASRWEVTRQLVLPAATPGRPDGDRARALAGPGRDGAAPPGRRRPRVLLRHRRIERVFTGSYTALPVIVYDWSRKPQEGFRAEPRRRSSRSS